VDDDPDPKRLYAHQLAMDLDVARHCGLPQGEPNWAGSSRLRRPDGALGSTAQMAHCSNIG
jgi:hypothetical protein